MANLNTDIYKIASFVESIKKKHIEANEDSLMMSTFGYIGDMFSQQLQNNIIVASEWGEEMFPTRAKFERNILTYAMTSNITDIFAVPGVMNIMIGIREDDVTAYIEKHNANPDRGRFIIDKNTPIYIEDYEFHLDYDIIIEKTILNNNAVYLAQYQMSEIDKNMLSDITSPYLTPPFKIKVGTESYLFITTLMRQVEFKYVYHTILSTNNIENKSFDFEFQSQIAHFDLLVERKGEEPFIVTPLYEGFPVTDNFNAYCYYSFISNDNVRIKFIQSSYNPELNDKITVRIKTTTGAESNFKYTQDILVAPTSDKYEYDNLILLIKPISDSENGANKKSIEDLQRMIPAESLSRGSITSDKDVENYFNILDNNTSRMVSLRKIDNQIERVYYLYLLLKDNDDNIIPTNNIDLSFNSNIVDPDNYATTLIQDNKVAIKPGTLFRLDVGSEYAYIDDTFDTTDPEDLDKIAKLEKEKFMYTNPFLIMVTRSPISVSYYLTILKRKYYTTFTWMEKANSFLQFVLSTISLERKYRENVYTIDIPILQNINVTEGIELVKRDDKGKIIDSETKLKVICAFKSAKGAYVRYKEAKIIYYDDSGNSSGFTVEFKARLTFTTDDRIDDNSNIVINDLYDVGTDPATTPYMGIYLPRVTNMSIFLLADLDGGTVVPKEKRTIDQFNIDTIVPNLDTYTLCNKYDVNGGIELFINYSDIISSKFIVDKLPNPDRPGELYTSYKLKSVPVMRYSYSTTEERVNGFIDKIIERKLYIDNALILLENSFGVDFKFFNTYGPSKIFRIGFGEDEQIIDRVNISIKFRMRFDVSADEKLKDYIIDEIKAYIENINNGISDLHVSNLVTHLTNKYDAITFIEFLGFNKYTPNEQYILRNDNGLKFYTPELLNIESTIVGQYSPDIFIQNI